MTDYYKNRRYFVYRHVAPNGKMYIGITSKHNPKDRWGPGGLYYSRNLHFWGAIQKYGWDNFKHIIVVHGVSVDTACHLEEYLIKKYDSMNNGYNHTSGGIYPTEITDEIRSAISNKVKAYHNSLPYGAWSDKFKGHCVSEKTKKKISNKHKGRKKSQEVIDRQVATFKKNLTPERRYMYGNSMRGKHLSDETKAKLSAAHTGMRHTQLAKDKMSKSLRECYANSSRVWIHNDIEELWVDEKYLPDFLSNGYIRGRRSIDVTYVTMGDKTIKISASELSDYIAMGWHKGFTPERHKNISKSRQKFIYNYKGMTFNTGKELALYLREHGYPKISQGTINAICQGKSVRAYPDLSIEIMRSIRNEDS